jgi:UDP-N-acetylmuramate--alanine ligase
MMFHRFTGLSRVHFVGIGGAGMSGIAEVLLDYPELTVTGCDKATGETVERLRRLGIEVTVGHAAEHVEGQDLVVISSAVPEDSAEVRAARERGITVVRRAEMLAELMRLKYGIAVAGTHGKTTTTSLVGTLMTDLDLDPTVIVGGRLRVSGTGARLGKSDYLVAEADEFDRSFLRLAPILAIITSIDEDHLDTYRDLEEIQDAFVAFASRVPFFGQVIVCLDDPNIQTILPRLADRRILTYGLSPQAELSAVMVEAGAAGCRFTVRRTAADGARELGEVELPMPGEHNVRNALAALAVGFGVGLEFEAMARSLASFGGVHRRFEQLGHWRGARVVDDYAHHPTEVTAALKAARQAGAGGRVHAVFQPHLYSRTHTLAEEFGRSLLGADHAVVTDVYASREAPIAGVSGELVVAAARAGGHRHVHYCPRWQDAPALLANQVREGDLVLTLGAGDVYRLGRQLVEGGTP